MRQLTYRSYCCLGLLKNLELKAIFLIFLLFVGASVQAGEVKVYAAASLADAVTELSNIYQKSHKALVIKSSFAGSATLAKQIENGAPADIFISADTDWPHYLQQRNLLLGESLKTLLRNELVFIAPLGTKSTVVFDASFNLSTSFTGRLCTGNTSSVPVGKYAKQSLLYYAWWDALSSRLVGTEDVRSALVFVERGECKLGIVYKTDALLSKKITILGAFPSVSHNAIEYAGALTKNATQEAKLFWAFLESDEAKVVFSRYGFLPLN